MNTTSAKLHKSNHESKIDAGKQSALEHCLPYLLSSLFGCILEDCIIQLRILSECNNEMRIMKTNADMDLLRALKFHVKQDASDLWNSINTKNLDSDQYKLDKLCADRKYLIDVLQQTYKEIALHRCFSSLSSRNKEIEDRDEYLAQLIEEEGRNRIARRELSKHLRQHRNHIKTVIYDTNLTVDHLKTQVENQPADAPKGGAEIKDTEINSETRSRLVVNWQRARTEQNDQTILDKESVWLNSINYYQNRSDQEQRIHSEVELLVNIFINETLTKVENWMIKYDEDMEAQDLNIAIMKNKYQDIVHKRKEMEETYATHETFMKKWLQFKEDRQKAIDYREKMNNSAIVVQAWWRGLLVRLQMGPYKPKKKPRPVNKKEKK